MYQGLYKSGPIQPVAQVGHNLLLIDRMRYNLYQVAYIEPIPPSHPLVADVGAVNAGVTDAIFNTNNVLDMEDGHLGQFRARVLDDIAVDILQPQSSTRFTLKNVIARLSAYTHVYDEHDALTEFFIFEDDRIFLRALNPTDYNLAQGRVAFYGFKYVLAGGKGVADRGGEVPPIRTFTSIEEAERSGLKYTVIPVGGWGR